MHEQVWPLTQLVMMVLKLVETYFLPRLLYGCETVDKYELDVVWNNGFRHV